MRRPIDFINKLANTKVDRELNLTSKLYWTVDITDGIGSSDSFKYSSKLSRKEPAKASKSWKYARMNMRKVSK